MIKILIPVKMGIYFPGFPIELEMRNPPHCQREKFRVESF
jgi:hypothetical protein